MRKSEVKQVLLALVHAAGEAIPNHEGLERIPDLADEGLVVTLDKGISQVPKQGILILASDVLLCEKESIINGVHEQDGLLLQSLLAGITA